MENVRTSMSDALSEDALNIGTESRAGVTRLRVIGQVRGRCLANAEHLGPLLNLLPEVLRVKRSVPEEENHRDLSGKDWR